jgi:hydrogenase maturation protein HypF
LKLAIRGAVQGVGFRPFVFRLAGELGLKGWVNNSAQGVFIEAEGGSVELEQFRLRLDAEKPPRSFIQSLEAAWLDPVGYGDFEIRASQGGGARTALILPDLGTCPDCLREILDPRDRRYFYPFTNCTHCGPRFSIIESLPYDRGNTSMKKFAMCPQCQAEYDDPGDRRFHAQPNACPRCGPRVELWDSRGKVLSGGADPAGAAPPERGHTAPAVLAAAAQAIRAGRIVAVKGLGGFHLAVAARDEQAVRRLRRLKHREEKPLALMFPTLAALRTVCEVSAAEERLLRCSEAPIVLLRRLHGPHVTTSDAEGLAPSIAPGNPNLGVMLPYTPLHHLLLSLLAVPIVATSGNLSDEPICTDEHEALERLGRIADLFLVHDRPIVRHVDDSIVRVMMGRELVLRRARGYAPLPIGLSHEWRGPRAEGQGPSDAPDAPRSTLHAPDAPRSTLHDSAKSEGSGPAVLGVGAHLKNTVALSVGSQVFISQHIGDLETEPAYEAFRRVIGDFERLYESEPAVLAADAHPDYLSTKYALERVSGAAPAGSLRLVSVQHHVAHVLSCMAENELPPPALGVSWDGTGYGLDGTVWGGEFFVVTEFAWERVAHFRCFPLPGGERAVKEPRRTALGLLFEMLGEAAVEQEDLAPVRAFSRAELVPLKTMLARRLNSPLTSSAGRLFDAVASLTGLCQQVRFEGQAAMELEFALDGVQTDESYPFSIESPPPTPPNPLLPVGPRASDLALPWSVERGASGAPLGPRTSDSSFRNSDFGVRTSALTVDWSPMVGEIIAEVRRDVPAGLISARFHNTLAEMIVEAARRTSRERVVLSGGCFQNRYLTERAVGRLQSEGFRPYWHQRIPPNDGGIALGQVVAALRCFGD